MYEDVNDYLDCVETLTPSLRPTPPPDNEALDAVWTARQVEQRNMRAAVRRQNARMRAARHTRDRRQAFLVGMMAGVWVCGTLAGAAAVVALWWGAS